MAHLLDNPFWASLTTSHAHLSVGYEHIKRYPAQFGPFVAVADSLRPVERELEELVAPGESVDVAGVGPPAFPRGWELLEHAFVLQMMCTRPIEVPKPIARWRVLQAQDRDAMLALTKLVYPGYFRARTNEMGQYFGIDPEGGIAANDGMLAAMAGERIATPQFVEVSGVCTHPSYLGRGYAGFLVSLLVNDILARGFTPFLHVSEQNARAIPIYERLGFTVRKRIELWLVRKP
ncbi:MAG TPA: GNAT family N-acetyltransferase [Steroidobacteraceae bacterium]|nr:GNAT family N-acetyltransferase [Steroidobacteraceae bacterium]